MQKNIDTALLLGSPFGPRYGTNNPYNADTQEQYFAQRTKMFDAERLKWASNVVNARVQGLDYSNFFAYTQIPIRTSALIDPTTGKNLGSDWQRIIAMDMNIDFLPRGAKVIFNGNVWLVTNPMNIQSVTGTTVIRRCNVVWNYLDEYGNVQSEPFCFGQGWEDLATTNNIQEQMTLMNGYQHCAMQMNPQTSALHHNYRIILGSQAYSVRGLQDFVLEFSQDPNSSYIQFFDLQVTEPLESDDMERKIASGLAFEWTVSISGEEEMQQGAQQTLIAQSTQNGNPVTLETSYAWSSSNEAAATVDATGTVSAVAPGDCVISAALVQNPSLTAEIPITVVAAQTGLVLFWTHTPPESLSAYQSATVGAGLTENGQPVQETVEWSFAGADEKSYTAEVSGNTAVIQCWQADSTPLTVTASYGGKTISAQVALLGW